MFVGGAQSGSPDSGGSAQDGGGGSRDGGADAPRPGEIMLRPVDLCGGHPGCAHGSGLSDLVWTGSRYALLTDNNGSHLELLLIDPEGGVSPPVKINEESMAFTSAMVWDGAQLVVFWRSSSDDKLRCRAVDGGGQLLGPTRTLLAGLSERDFSLEVAAAEQGYAALVVFDDDKARFLRWSAFPELSLLAESVPLDWPQITSKWDHPSSITPLAQGFAVGINPRHGEYGAEAVYLARLSDLGQIRNDPLRLFQSGPSVTGGEAMVMPDGRLLATYNDDFERIYLAEVSTPTWQFERLVQLQHEGDISRAVLLPFGQSEAAMFAATNLWQGHNGFPTTLVFEVFALPGGDRTARIVVEGGPEELGEAMFEWRMVRSGDSLGLAWESLDQGLRFGRVTR